MVTMQKSKHCKDNTGMVTFTMPVLEDCECLYLVGTFYPGNESTYRMQREEDGTWSLSLELDSTHEFHYRFRTDNGAWLEDDVCPGSPSAAALLN